MLILATLLALSIPLVQPQQYEGDNCVVDGSAGVCTLLPQCTFVYNELLAGRPPKKICGFSNFEPIVCCPRDSGFTQKPSPTLPTQKPTQKPTPRPTPRPTPPRPITEKPVNRRGAIARAKCAEYSKSLYVLRVPPTLSGNREPINESLCALPKTKKLIVGGKKADPKEFPHMTAIGYDGRENGILWLCGGTLVSENTVLTAAHCTYSADWGRAAWARVGDLNLVTNDDDALPQDRRITDRIRHPKYKRPSQYHDIAVLKLERPVEFNAWTRPACLPTVIPETGNEDKAIATGWGRVDWTDEEGSSDLLKVTLNLVPQTRCNASFVDGSQHDDNLKFGIVEAWQLCAGQFGKDTCQGDSGGPLVTTSANHDCMYDVIGVTSLGRLCGSIIPGVYTRVYHYVPWLESVIWPEYS